MDDQNSDQLACLKALAEIAAILNISLTKNERKLFHAGFFAGKAHAEKQATPPPLPSSPDP